MTPQLLLLNAPAVGDALPNREGTATFGTLSGGFLYPPHTLATAAAACRQAGITVSVLDAVAERLSLAACIERVQAIQPENVAVFSSWGTLDVDRAAYEALRKALPHTPLLAVGAGARYSADELLLAGASHVLLGDPELALPALLKHPLPAPGLLRTRDVLPAAHNHAGLIRDPGQLPRPAWELIPWQRYGFLSVFASRGCDERCRYCAYVVAHGHAFRPRPLEDVAAEMLWLQETFAPARIMVRDPVFAVERARVMDLLARLRAANFHTPWECESRPEHFDRDMLRRMAASGCTTIKLGIESGHPEELVRLGRVQTPREAATYLTYTRRVVADARRYGIRTRAFVLVGLPGQTQEHIEATAAYLRQLRPTFVHARPYVAYPRVPLGEAQPESLLQQHLARLQPVVDACQAAAARERGLLPRLRRRLQRAWWRRFS